MTAQTLFFTDRPIGGLATYIGGSEDKGSIDYRYKEMIFNCPCIIPSDIIPGLVQYGIWPGFSLWIFDLAKEYLMKVGNVFILTEVCLGYPIPPHKLMPEVVLDLKGSNTGEWPPSLLDTLPDERTEKNYRLEKDTGDFIGYTPSKKEPFLEWFVKYRLINTGTP